MMGPLDADGLDNIRLLPPNYIYQISAPIPPPPPEPQPSGVHPSSDAYVKMGKGYLAPAIMAEAMGPGFHGVKILRAEWRSPTQIDLHYSLPIGPLVVDLSGAIVRPPSWGLAGFQVFNELNVQTAVSAVTVVKDPDIEVSPNHAEYEKGSMRIIRLTLASTPTGYAMRVHYATRNDESPGVGVIIPGTSTVFKNAGPITGARGCIRDSSPYPIFANSQVWSTWVALQAEGRRSWNPASLQRTLPA
jgi:hypothetical protein